MKNELSPKEGTQLLATLKGRFEQNPRRHQGLVWATVETKLAADAGKLWSLSEMENTGGEPDVTGHDASVGEFIFTDCSPETPKGRLSLCYDPEALDARKENKPKGSALGMAAAMGVELLTEEQYRELQSLGAFDLKTSCWLQTPAEIRKAAARSSAIAVMAVCLFIITASNRITIREVFAARCAYSLPLYDKNESSRRPLLRQAREVGGGTENPAPHRARVFAH